MCAAYLLLVTPPIIKGTQQSHDPSPLLKVLMSTTTQSHAQQIYESLFLPPSCVSLLINTTRLDAVHGQSLVQEHYHKASIMHYSLFIHVYLHINLEVS